MPTQETTKGTVDALGELSIVPPFCADPLPEWLHDYTGELAVRYTVPQSDLLLACIATAGTAGRRWAKTQLGWGARPVAPNLLVVFRPGDSSNLLPAVQHIVAPLVARQHEMLRRQEAFESIKIQKQVEGRGRRTPVACLGE